MMRSSIFSTTNKNSALFTIAIETVTGASGPKIQQRSEGKREGVVQLLQRAAAHQGYLLET